MRKLKERFHRKHGIFRPVFSLILVLAMIMTMIPSIGGMATAYADGAIPTIRLYLDKPSTWNTPVFNIWPDGANVNNNGAGNAPFHNGGVRKNQSLHVMKVLDSIM